jgi:hypothetical protein
VVLDALLREGSATRAAKRLGRTQSAISHALPRLRDVFGDPLFVRVGPALRPTPRADALRAPLAHGASPLTGRLGSFLSRRPGRPSRGHFMISRRLAARRRRGAFEQRAGFVQRLPRQQLVGQVVQGLGVRRVERVGLPQLEGVSWSVLAVNSTSSTASANEAALRLRLSVRDQPTADGVMPASRDVFVAVSPASLPRSKASARTASVLRGKGGDFVSDPKTVKADSLSSTYGVMLI